MCKHSLYFIKCAQKRFQILPEAHFSNTTLLLMYTQQAPVIVLFKRDNHYAAFSFGDFHERLVRENKASAAVC